MQTLNKTRFIVLAYGGQRVNFVQFTHFLGFIGRRMNFVQSVQLMFEDNN